MKNEELPVRPKHLLTEHEPTVLHHPEEDETILARWLRKGLEQGTMFWLGLAALLATVLGIWLVTTLYANREPAQAKTWKELILAEDTAKRAELGKSSTGPVASWALIQAAETRYMEGFQDLPQNRDSALEKMKAAYDLFLQAREKSAAGTHDRFYASMGLARTLEARGEVDDAIKQYDELATAWADTPLGEEAKRYSERLNKPASREYYKEFAVFQPTPAILPPGGSLDLGLPLPGLPGGSRTLPGNVIPGLGNQPALTPPASSTAEETAAPAAPATEATTTAPAAGTLPSALEPEASTTSPAPVVIPEPAPASESSTAP